MEPMDALGYCVTQFCLISRQCGRTLATSRLGAYCGFRIKVWWLVKKYKLTMKINRNAVIWGVFVALQLVSIHSFALTLGRVNGVVLLGRELDLSVLVQFASDEDLSGTCFDADLSYGDASLDRSRYTVRAEAGPQPNTQLVRVHAAARVNDALVRLNLKTVCGPKASRRYVLLSDVVSELEPTDVALASAVTSRNAVAVPAGSKSDGLDSPLKSASLGSGPTQTRPSVKASKVVRETALPNSTKAAVSSPASDASSRPRVEVTAVALEDLQKRVDEIAKWQSSNGGAQALEQNDARAKALETSIRELQLVTTKNQQSLQLVEFAMERSASQNYGRTLLYLLLALLLACVAALAYVMTRLRRGAFDSAPWWKDGDLRTSVPAPADKAHVVSEANRQRNSLSAPLESDALPTHSLSATEVSTAPGVQGGDSGLDALVTVLTEQGTAPLPMVAVSQEKPKPGRPDFASSGHSTLRSINTREMLDVRQQAEFFMALGQHDEAVRLLESNISGSVDANPLVYLDLLKILHTLSRRTDFERYREEFNAQFTGRIPDYADFLSQGNGLEDYEDICNQIVVLWPTEYTIDFIEQCLVRTPEDDPEQGMDLEAFRDLLLLYGVLKRLDQFYDSNFAPFSASRPSNLPLGTAADAAADAQARVPLPTLTEKPGLAPTPPIEVDIELDLDLDVSSDQAQQKKQVSLMDYDVTAYTNAAKPAADK